MQLTQLNSVQPISAKQVSRVFVFAFFTQSLKALVDTSYKQARFFPIILLTFLQILHSKIPSLSKLVKTRHI